MKRNEKQNLTTTTSGISDSISVWAIEFIKAKRVEGLSPYTLTFYKQQLGHFFKFCKVHYSPPLEGIAGITPATIRDYMLWLEKDEGHNPGGVHGAYRVLKAYLRWWEMEVEPDSWHNPFSKVKAPKLTEELIEPVALIDVDRMTRTCKGGSFTDVRDIALMLFLLDTGARASECLACNLSDVDSTTGDVIIRKGKGGASRTVFLERKARRAYRTYLKIRTDTNPAAWITDECERLKYNGLRAMLVRRADAADVSAPSPHDFRRAFAINMLRNGVDLISLARLMGHRSLEVLRRYLKQVTEDLQEAHRKGSPVEHMKGGDDIDR